MDTLTFDGRLRESDLVLLKQCIGLQVDHISFIKGSCFFTEGQILHHVECHETCGITLSDSNKTKYELYLTTLKGVTHLPLIEQGRLEVKLHIDPWRPLKERMESPAIHNNMQCVLFFSEKEILIGIKLYGNHLRAMLNQIDEDIDLNYLKETHGLLEFPYIECDSIEFLVLEFSSGLRTFIQLDEYFIIVIPNTNLPIDDYLSRRSQFNFTGEEIKLQHELVSK